MLLSTVKTIPSATRKAFGIIASLENLLSAILLLLAVIIGAFFLIFGAIQIVKRAMDWIQRFDKDPLGTLEDIKNAWLRWNAKILYSVFSGRLLVRGKVVRVYPVAIAIIALAVLATVFYNSA